MLPLSAPLGLPLALGAAAFISPAAASSDGAMAAGPIIGGFDCGQCHNQTGQFLDLAPEGYRADIQLEVVDGDDAAVLVADETRRLRLTIDSAAAVQTGETGRKVGFAIAVVEQGGDGWTRTGQLEPVDDRAHHPPVQDADVTHSFPLPQEDGRVQLELELTPWATGDHLVYVVVNDVDGDGAPSTGDYVWPQRFCFTVDAAGAATGEECDTVLARGEDSPAADDTGATAASGARCQAAPAGALWLLGPALLLIVGRRGVRERALR